MSRALAIAVTVICGDHLAPATHGDGLGAGVAQGPEEAYAVPEGALRPPLGYDGTAPPRDKPLLGSCASRRACEASPIARAD